MRWSSGTTTLALATALAAWSCHPSVDPSGATATSSGGACPDALADCDGNGCTTNPSQDPFNCGACGHSCAEGACNTGVCSAPPEIIAEHGGELGGLALDDGAIYWSQDSTIVRRAKDGGDATVITTAQAGPIHLAVDATHVYWTEPSSGNVARAPKMGGVPEILAAGEAEPFGLAVDAAAVYWTTVLGNTIRRWPKTGGPAQTLTGAPSNSTDLALDADAVYWTSGVDGGDLGRVLKTDGATPLLLTVEGIPGAIAVDATDAYVWVSDPTTKPWRGQPRRVAKTGGPMSALAPYGASLGGRLTLDATHLYWCSSGLDNVLQKVSKQGGAPVSLASGNYQCGDIAIDETHVYWTDIGAHRVLRTPK